MTDAFIYDAMRTPRDKGKKDGALYSVKPVNLTAGLLCAVRRRNDLDTAQVDDVVFDYVAPVGDWGVDIAKTAAPVADWDGQVAGVQIDRFCASGLETTNLGMMKVHFGFKDLVPAGGVKPMSCVPTGSDDGAQVPDPETNLRTSFTPQGIGVDLIAILEGFSRTGVDASALHSQQKVTKARAEGLSSKLPAPVAGQNGIVLLDHDESIHTGSTLEGLAALKPSLEMVGQVGLDATTSRKYSQVECIEYVHTPGNSPRIVDDASAMFISSETRGRELGLKARVRIVATVMTFTDPTTTFTGPTPVTRKVLAKVNLKAEDIDLFEVNGALASVVMKFMKDMGVTGSKVNTNGGVIAMGHPLGATGYITLGTLLDGPGRRNLHCGLATLCINDGIGIATIIEHV